MHIPTTSGTAARARNPIRLRAEIIRLPLRDSDAWRSYFLAIPSGSEIRLIIEGVTAKALVTTRRCSFISQGLSDRLDEDDSALGFRNPRHFMFGSEGLSRRGDYKVRWFGPDTIRLYTWTNLHCDIVLGRDVLERPRSPGQFLNATILPLPKRPMRQGRGLRIGRQVARDDEGDRPSRIQGDATGLVAEA